MKLKPYSFITRAVAITSALFTSYASAEFQKLSTYNAGAFDEGAAEIAVFDPSSDLVYSVNSNDKTVDIINIADPANPSLLRQVSFSGSVNSVDVFNGLAAAAVEGVSDADNGNVVFFNAMGETQFTVPAGNLPDSLSFSPDGSKVIVANEGEPFGVVSGEIPNQTASIVDPEGSVTVIDVAAQSAVQLDFTAFNDQQAALATAGVKFTRIADGATVAQNLQPEFVAITPDSSSAAIAMQEANALAIVSLGATPSITDIIPLGYKDWSTAGSTAGFDASDKDNAINIRN